ncbi:unnamed protein product [Amoebophrya sp. A120]|nr:unnamed protein product [Amoebophrya sp. A120]|eukprot:GSA120T00025020001.1
MLLLNRTGGGWRSSVGRVAVAVRPVRGCTGEEVSVFSAGEDVLVSAVPSVVATGTEILVMCSGLPLQGAPRRASLPAWPRANSVARGFRGVLLHRFFLVLLAVARKWSRWAAT